MEDDPSKYLELLEPKDISELVGQRHLFGKGKPLFEYYHSSRLPPSMILFGPPGVGKTTYARLLARKHGVCFEHVNATSVSLARLREIFGRGRIVAIVDEIHRLDRKQQEVMLPFLEHNRVVLVGTSTENPYFRLSKALRSRCFLYEFRPLTSEEIGILLERAIRKWGLEIDDRAKEIVILRASHDARRLYNLLSVLKGKRITRELVEIFSGVDVGYDSETERYDVISAFIKSIRGSDPDSALYYLARMLEAGEDIEFIARRLCILAAEDIGLANPNAVNVASSTLVIVKDIGMPEARIPLSMCTIYLSLCKKSNSSYLAIKRAIADVRSGNIMSVPSHLKVHPDGKYLYPHSFPGGYVKQRYTEKKVKYFEKKETDRVEF